MIVLEWRDAQQEAQGWIEPPSIYFDTWALTTFARDATYQTRFLNLFKDRGTLVFSLMNVFEIASHAGSERPEMRLFLEKIGPHWFPLTIDPLVVIERQDAGRQDAFVSYELLKDPLFAQCLMGEDLSLVHVIDLTRGSGGDDLRTVTQAEITQMRKNLELWREDYSKDPKVVDAKWPHIMFDPIKSMRPIYNALIRLSIKDSFTLTDSHCCDLLHTISSLAFGGMVLLDGHWAEQARKVQRLLVLHTDFVKIYAPNQLDQFLGDLASYAPNRALSRPKV